MQELMQGITIDHSIKGGKPVIKGTRVTVEFIIGKLGAGISYEELMTEYDLKREQILSALCYAANMLSEEEIRMVP